MSIVPFGAAFRQRGTGLIAIGHVWEGLLESAPQDADDAPQWPFVHVFRHVLLPGESEPIPLAPTQSALLKILWAMAGKPLAGQDLLHRAGLRWPSQWTPSRNGNTRRPTGPIAHW